MDHITRQAENHIVYNQQGVSMNAWYLYFFILLRKAKGLNVPFQYTIRAIVDDLSKINIKMGKITVTKAIRELVKYGLISKEKPTSKIIYYRVVL